jgi:hypothetical protein
MKRFACVFLFMFFLVMFLGADENDATVDRTVKPIDVNDLLGLDLNQAYEKLGVPFEIFPLRGETAEQDDVVFYYKNHLYLFWFRNKVWQVRLDERYKEDFLGIRIGMTREKVIQTLDCSYKIVDESLIFIMPDRGYPVRLRLFFTSNKLKDAYLYRGDF